MTLNRRQILFGAAAVAVAPRDARLETRPLLELRPGPHLFIDDHLIEHQQDLRRRVVSPQRDLPGPVITGPLDGNFQPYVTVVRDPQSKRFRVWYNVPVDAGQSHLGYMESNDGIRWERPHQVLPDPARIQFGASVIDEGSSFPDQAKRFKLGWWNAGGLQIASSPDGRMWTPLAPGVVLPHNHDINSIHWDPIRKRYLGLVSSYTTGPTWQGKRRVTMQSVSDDLVHWEKPHTIITPNDGEDEGETQFYCMSGILARGDLLIGMLKVLRDDLPADPGGPVTGIGYTCLAWSRDGKTWTRDRTPFLDRHPQTGAWDHAMSWADCQVPVGDEVFIYYGGYERGHKTERFKERQIGLVRMPRDRYVSRDAGDAVGTLRTPLLKLKAARMTLNANARLGEIRVAVLDAAGKPFSGFRAEDCRPITGDSLTAPVRWKQPLGKLKGQLLRLEFQVRRAGLFSFELR